MDEQHEESRRELAEKQRSEVERFKADEVLTLKESVNIDYMVGGAGRRPETVGANIAPATAPVTQAGAPVTKAAPGQQLPTSFQMAAPLNEVIAVVVTYSTNNNFKTSL